jgi:hypothetical protein
MKHALCVLAKVILFVKFTAQGNDILWVSLVDEQLTAAPAQCEYRNVATVGSSHKISILLLNIPCSH